MTNKQYPTRMHEVLGVAENEEFYSEDKMLMRVNRLGRIERKMDTHPCGWDLMCNTRRVEDCINHGITRRPRLTEEQADQLKALVTLGYRWLVEERGGTVVAVNHEVKKGEVRWVLTNPRDSDDVVCDVHQSLSVKSLVSWSDPAPLDIVQTLRGAGVSVEVEG